MEPSWAPSFADETSTEVAENPTLVKGPNQKLIAVTDGNTKLDGSGG